MRTSIRSPHLMDHWWAILYLFFFLALSPLAFCRPCHFHTETTRSARHHLLTILLTSASGHRPRSWSVPVVVLRCRLPLHRWVYRYTPRTRPRSLTTSRTPLLDIRQHSSYSVTVSQRLHTMLDTNIYSPTSLVGEFAFPIFSSVSTQRCFPSLSSSSLSSLAVCKTPLASILPTSPLLPGVRHKLALPSLLSVAYYARRARPSSPLPWTSTFAAPFDLAPAVAHQYYIHSLLSFWILDSFHIRRRAICRRQDSPFDFGLPFPPPLSLCIAYTVSLRTRTII